MMAAMYVQVWNKPVIGTWTAKKSSLTKETQLQVTSTTSHIIGLIETVTETWLCVFVCVGGRGVALQPLARPLGLQLLLGEQQTG